MCSQRKQTQGIGTCPSGQLCIACAGRSLSLSCGPVALVSLLVTLLSTCLGLLWIRLAGCFYTCLLLPLCGLPAQTLLAKLFHARLSPACLPACYTCLLLPQATLETLGRSCLLLVCLSPHYILLALAGFSHLTQHSRIMPHVSTPSVVTRAASFNPDPGRPACLWDTLSLKR